AQIVMCGCQVGLQPNRLLTMRQGLFGPTEVQKKLAKICAGWRVIRSKFYRAAEMAKGIVQPAQFAQTDPEIVVSDPKVGTKPQSTVEFFYGLVMPAETL